jgi:TrmH family RNA methyltransferase
MDPSQVDVILVRPWRAANVAAACRAMKNMGVARLTLVGPPEGLEDPSVRASAYGAWDVLDARTEAPTLRAAVAPCTLVVGTSGKEDAHAWTPRALAEEGAHRAAGGRVGLVFGPEASGLTNEELGLCQVRVHIPSHPAQPSLNLAQAVLVLCYEIFVSGAPALARASDPPASAGELEDAVAELREGLIGIGFLNPTNPEPILSELRGLLARGLPTGREVSLLRGVARQVRWAAERCADATRRP